LTQPARAGLDIPAVSTQAPADPAKADPAGGSVSDSGKTVVAAPGSISPNNLGKLEELERWGKGTVLSLAISPDGRLAAFSTRRGIALYDTSTYRQVRFIEAEGGYPKIAFSPDGQTLAAANVQSVVTLFNTSDGAILRIIDGGEIGQPLALLYFTDGRTLYLGTSMELAVLWDTETGKLVHRWITSGGTAMSASQDGYFLVSANYEGNLYVWTAQDGKGLGRLWHGSDPQSALFGPDSQLVAVSYGDNSVVLWNAMDGKATFTLQGHSDRVAATAFAPDGKILATGSWDGSIILWNTATGKQLTSLHGQGGRVEQVAFGSNGRSLTSVSDDGIVRVWSVPGGVLLNSVEDFIPLGQAVYSPDGKTVATGAEDGKWRLWQAADGSLLRGGSGHPGGISALAFSPDGKILASSGIDKVIRLWQVADGSLLHELNDSADWISSLDISPDGTMLAASTRSPIVLIWSIPDGSLRARIDTGGDTILKAKFDPDGASLWTGSMDGSLKQWRIEDGSLLATLKDSGPFISLLAFSPDRSWLASAGDGRWIELRPVSGGSLVRIIDGYQDFGVSALAFSPSGEMIYAGFWDKTFRIYSVANAALLRKIDFNYVVRAISISPDGARLALSLDDGTVRIWGLK
jgi:WD40 repeat protein